MGKRVLFFTTVLLAVCAVVAAGCGKGKLSEDNGENQAASNASDSVNASGFPKEGVESKKLSREEAKAYQDKCKSQVAANIENNDNNTNRALESIEAEFGELKSVIPDNYGESKEFSQFAMDCAYLDIYLEEDSPGKEVGAIGLKYVSQILQGKKGYQKTLEEFQTFYSDNIEELYDHCYYTGRYVVGQSKVNAGEYVLFTDNPDGAVYTVYADADSGTVVQSGKLFYDVIIILEDGECLELGDFCKAVPISEVDYIDEEEGTMFKVGTHLEAGTYQLKASGKAKYSICPDARLQTKPAASEEFSGTTDVTLKDGEYLVLENCHLVSGE